MKITILGTAKFEEGTPKFVEGEGVSIGIEVVIGERVHATKRTYSDGTGFDMNECNKQKFVG
jgi:hypothetical protein